MGTTSSAGPGGRLSTAADSAASPWLAADSGRATRTRLRVMRANISSIASPSGPQSCNSRPPELAQATSPHRTIMGTPDKWAEATPVTALVAPGPAVTMTPATRPLLR
jgi:hypothetical protein